MEHVAWEVEKKERYTRWYFEVDGIARDLGFVMGGNLWDWNSQLRLEESIGRRRRHSV